MAKRDPMKKNKGLLIKGSTFCLLSAMRYRLKTTKILIYRSQKIANIFAQQDNTEKGQWNNKSTCLNLTPPETKQIIFYKEVDNNTYNSLCFQRSVTFDQE